jgi:hypothetical protein
MSVRFWVRCVYARGDQTAMTPLNEITSLLEPASPDELHVALLIVRRLMGKGRKNYGPMMLATDKRDFGHEGAEEACDALVYWAADLIKRRYRVAAFAAANDNDGGGE